MTSIQQSYASILASKLRKSVLKTLEKKPLRPVEICNKTGKMQPNISRALFQLEKEGLVECLTPKKKAWRVYAITEKGKSVLREVSGK